jgi:hypothetical protein
MISATDPHSGLSQFSRPGDATFPFKYLLSYPHEAEWTPFQIHYFSENLVAPEIESGISRSVASFIKNLYTF